MRIHNSTTKVTSIILWSHCLQQSMRWDLLKIMITILHWGMPGMSLPSAVEMQYWPQIGTYIYIIGAIREIRLSQLLSQWLNDWMDGWMDGQMDSIAIANSWWFFTSVKWEKNPIGKSEYWLIDKTILASKTLNLRPGSHYMAMR